MENYKTLTLRLDKDLDADILEFLTLQQSKTLTIKKALRFLMQEKGCIRLEDNNISQDLLTREILKALWENDSLSVSEFYDIIAERLNVGEKYFQEISEKTGDNKFKKLVRFGLLNLKNSQQIESISRGVYKLTEFGEFTARYLVSEKPPLV